MKQTCKAEIIVAPFKEKVSPTLKLSLTTPMTMESWVKFRRQLYGKTAMHHSHKQLKQPETTTKKQPEKHKMAPYTYVRCFLQVYKSSEILKDIIYNPFIATIFTKAAKKLKVWPTLCLNNVFSNQCGISGGCDYADELYVCFISVVFLCFNDWSFILGELVL